MTSETEKPTCPLATGVGFDAGLAQQFSSVEFGTNSLTLQAETLRRRFAMAPIRAQVVAALAYEGFAR